MSINVTSWLPNLLGPVTFLLNGSAQSVPKRLSLNFIGTGITVEDNSSQDRTDITIPTFDVSPGTNGNVLTSNGSAWTSAAPSGGGSSPDGTDNDVQFNVSGALAADTGKFTYDPATGEFKLSRTGAYITPGGTVPASGFIRFPYNGASAVPILVTKDSGGVDQDLISIGSGDRWRLGTLSQDLTLYGGTLTAAFEGGVSSFTHVGFSFYALGAAANTFELRNNGATWIEGAERHKTVEKDDNYTMVVGLDFHIIATVSGKTITLPNTVGDGDVFKVSNTSGGNITVSGNLITIYGVGASETLADGETQEYCYTSGALSGLEKWVRV
jgi:hypothetical protein